MKPLLIYLLAIVPLLSLVSIAVYWWDKRSAQSDHRRIPEKSLLTIDLLGGWPGGLYAQRKFRHKTQKVSFRIQFWFCVAANLIAICVVGWSLFK